MLEGTKARQAGSLAERSTRPMGLLGKGILALGLPLLFCGCDGLGGASNSTQATLVVFPDEDFLIAGPEGGPFFPASKVYLVSNAGEETMQWSVLGTSPQIGFSTSSGSLDGGESEIVTVFADVDGFPPGQYSASIAFANETTGTEVVEHAVSLTVSAAGALEVSPTIGFSSTGPVGGPFDPLSAPYVLGNAGSSAIDWSIEISKPWLSASLAAGQLQASGSQNVTLSIDPLQAAQLIAGTHVASVVFHDLTNASDFEILVTLTAIEPARLQVTPADGFTTAGPPSGPFSPPSKTYTLSNSGGQLLSWQVTRNTNWVTRSRVSGSLAPGQQTTVVIGINSTITSSFSDGTYTDTLFFTNLTNGLGDDTRPVDLTLTTPPAILTVTPAQPFSSAGQVGGPFQPASKTFTLSNSGATALNWQALASTAWLALSPASGSLVPGASTQVVASIQQGVAASLPVGQHTGQLTFTNLTSGTGNTSVGASVNISASGGAVPVLTAGSGFFAPTQEPGQIGTGTAKSIARWDVVPYQTIVEATTPTFTVGVVAFHIAGIARVSFSLEGGPFVDATSMTLNPETGVWEYCATIDASDFTGDQPIELRAIAYPNAAAPQAAGTGAYPGGGYPRLLDSLFLYIDAGTLSTPPTKYASALSGSDSTGDGSVGNPYRSIWKAGQAIDAAGGSNHADGGTVYLYPGDYTWDRPGDGATPTTTHRWLTITPKPGVTRDQVHFRSAGWYPGLGIQKILLREVTLHDFLSASGGADSIWLDHCTCVGKGMGVPTSSWAGWFSGFAFKYCTALRVFDCESSLPGGVDIARDCLCERVTGGIGYPKLVVNCTWNGTDYGPSGGHADFISWNYLGQGTTVDNSIIYGVKGIGVHAQGIFFKTTGHLNNVAIVNTLINLLSQQTEIGQDCFGIDHLLLLNVTHDGIFYWEMPQSAMRNMSIRGCTFTFMSCPPPGNSVSNGWFDNCHYVRTSGSGNPIAPGMNLTTGDPLFTNSFYPRPGSPLLNRMQALVVPIDTYGSARTAPGTVGAVE